MGGEFAITASATLALRCPPRALRLPLPAEDNLEMIRHRPASIVFQSTVALLGRWTVAAALPASCQHPTSDTQQQEDMSIA